MDDLPLVPAMRIIDYLSIDDILNLKLLNKWFYRIINGNVRIKDLVLSNCDDLPYNRRWFYTYDLVSLQRLMKRDSFQNANLFLEQSIISNQLKRLYIYQANLTFDLLNSFQKLVHLEIIDSELNCMVGDNVLRLPMLEILNLDRPIIRHFYNIIVDSPKLRRLRFTAFPFYDTEFSHPESIDYLEVGSYDECKKFLQFCVNLEHFYCSNLYLDDLNKFNHLVKKRLTKLKSIHFVGSRDAFVKLVHENERIKKDLKLYFHNLEFDKLPDELDFDNWSILDHKMGKFYAQYYSRLADHCPFVKKINYNDLEEHFNKIPENFLSRFVNFDSLIVRDEVNDLDQLIKVLGDCKTIRYLELHSSFGQQFFDSHLFDLCPNIDSLLIHGSQVLDFEFVFKFKNICRFSVDQTLPIELAKRLIQNFKSIDDLEFYHRDVFRIAIDKYTIPPFLRLIINNETKRIHFSDHNTFNDLFEDLVSFCDHFE